MNELETEAQSQRPGFPVERLVGPAPDKPTKSELIHRRRGEVCALGRLVRALDKEPSCNARAVAQKHYAKAMRILKEAHQTPNA